MQEGPVLEQGQPAEQAVTGKVTLQQLRVATVDEVGKRRFQPPRY